MWNREELILAINLYCKLPFGRLHSRNPHIVKLASLLNRTPNAVAYKLVNFASLDPSLQARGIKGAANTSKLDKAIWEEFFHHWDVLAYESELLLAKKNHKTIEELNEISEIEKRLEGRTREQLIKARVNQNFFRKAVLSAYNDTCCITGISNRDFLIAGHISPWGVDEKNRMNPRNGIAVNALHDRAFELGYLTITPDYIIKVSPQLLIEKSDYASQYFHNFDNQSIILPSRFLPDVDLLKYHNENCYKS